MVPRIAPNCTVLRIGSSVKLTPKRTATALLHIGQWHERTDSAVGTLPTTRAKRDALERMLAETSSSEQGPQTDNLAAFLETNVGFPRARALTLFSTHPALCVDKGARLEQMWGYYQRWSTVSSSVREMVRRCLMRPPHLIALFLDDWPERLRFQRQCIAEYAPSVFDDLRRQQTLFLDPLEAWQRFTVPPALLEKRWQYLHAIPQGAWKAVTDQSANQHSGQKKVRVYEARQSLARQVALFLFDLSDSLPVQHIQDLEDARDDFDDPSDD